MEVTRSVPLTARVVLHAKPLLDRKDRSRQDMPARNYNSHKNARREREPWLLIASLSAHQVVLVYPHRMQIELSFGT